MRVIKAIVKWSAIVLAGFIALAIVLAIVDPPDDTESPETRATATPEVAATGEPTPTATAERTPQLTETERTARRIARDFRENFSGTSWYPEDHESRQTSIRSTARLRSAPSCSRTLKASSSPPRSLKACSASDSRTSARWT